jgi:hypothetical protein
MFDIILEGNTQQVINEINSNSQSLNRFGHFIEGIRSELWSLGSSNVVDVWREANSTCHFLARMTITHIINSI